MKNFIVLFIGFTIFFSGTISKVLSEEHPIILFTKDKIPIIQERIKRPPYLEWWNWIKQRADIALKKDFNKILDEAEKSFSAKALSFVALILKEKVYIDKAVEVLLLISPIQTYDEDEKWGNIHTRVSTIARYCEAYDMLFPVLNNSEVNKKIRDSLANLGEFLYIYRPGWYHVHVNNWEIRQFSSLGICSIVLSDYNGTQTKNPKLWYDMAVKWVKHGMNLQSVEGGGFAEGHSYLLYSAELYLPFFIGNKNFSADDFFHLPKIHELHDWSVKTRMPNGMRPNIDDSALTFFYGLMLTSVYEDGGIHRWDWETSSYQFLPDYSQIDAIALFDDSIPSTPPKWNPTIFMPEAGDAVFRSSWDKDAIYLQLRGEYGRARYAGGGHEHPDQLSFILYAYGELLALDSGYINWDNHGKVNKAKNHNLILVDGKGPTLVEVNGISYEALGDAYLKNCITSSEEDFCEVHATYQGVNFIREVYFPEKKYFIIVDKISSKTPHTYELLFHGNGGGTSGGTFQLEPDGGTWIYRNAKLTAKISSKSNLTFSYYDDIHSLNYGEELTHTVLKVGVKGDNVTVTTLLLPSSLK